MVKSLPVGRGPVCLDTAAFIYFMEDHPTYAPVVAPLFERVADGELQAITSGITLLETIVRPLRLGNKALADQYTDLLTHGVGLKMLPVSLSLLQDAAYIRARTQVKTPDAIQLAAALRSRCSAFVTNDRRLPEMPGLKIIQLNDHV